MAAVRVIRFLRRLLDVDDTNYGPGKVVAVKGDGSEHEYVDALAGSAGATGATGAGSAGATGATGTGLNFVGPWDAFTNYAPGDVVEHGGAIYVATTNHINSEPPSADWAPLPGQTGPVGATGATGAGTTGATGPVAGDAFLYTFINDTSDV